jgi:hypothetical protein
MAKENKKLKCGTWFVLWFARGAKIYTLVKFVLASQQNIEFSFYENGLDFFNCVQIVGK